MKPMPPTQAHFDLPPGTRGVKVAEHQPQYQTLPAFVTPDGRVVTQWEPSLEERAAIAAGAPVTLIVSTFNQPLQPLQMGVVGELPAGEFVRWDLNQ